MSKPTFSRNRKTMHNNRLDPAKLRALSDAELARRIDAVQRVVSGLASDIPGWAEDFAHAVQEVGTRKGLDYKKALKQLRGEKGRRERELGAMLAKPMAPWTPFERTSLDPAQFDTPEAMARYNTLAEKAGKTPEEFRAIYRSLLDDEIYINSRYQVAVRRDNVPDGDGGLVQMVHMSVKRLDQLPIRDWRDMQRIKNELLGPECEAIELYPAESRVVDTANQYHMWGVNSGTFRWPVGWDQGQLKLDAEDGVDECGARQRPFEA